MENLIDCNLETIGALIIMCRKENKNLEELLTILYPFSAEEKGAKKWADGWNKKIITFTKEEQEELGDDIGFCIPSLKDETYRQLLIDRIKTVLEKVGC